MLERFRALLMLALYRSGRQVEALSAYREARTSFDQELGLELGDELQRLERAILHHPEARRPRWDDHVSSSSAADAVGTAHRDGAVRRRQRLDRAR